MSEQGLGWALWQTWLTYQESWRKGCRPFHVWGPALDGLRYCTRCRACRGA